MNNVIEISKYRQKKDAQKTCKTLNRLDFEKILIRKGKNFVINLLEKIIGVLKD